MDNYPPEMAPLIKRLADYTPARRMGTESEVFATIVFLLSPAAAFISGSCSRVDGADEVMLGIICKHMGILPRK